METAITSLPFDDGQATSGADGDSAHFALLEHDYETSTEHAQFRQYSSALGRWMSSDPYLGSYRLNNPQSFNRYAYAGNNPLAKIDPSGLDYQNAPDCPDDVTCIDGGDSGDGGGDPGDPGGGGGGGDPSGGGDGSGGSGGDGNGGNSGGGTSGSGGGAGSNDGYILEVYGWASYDPNSCDMSDPVCQIWLQNYQAGLGIGGVMGGIAAGGPSNGPQKSPARQQCEQQAQQQFHDAVQAENATIPDNLKTAAAEGFVGGLIGGCIAGAVATSPLGPGAGAGCVAVAVPSALWGALIGPTISFGHSVFSELGMMSAYNNQVNNVCSKL